MFQPEIDPERRDRGFSLIEILIALTIFAVGIMAVAVLQTSAMRASSQSSALTMAMRSFTQNKAEELLALPTTDADLTAGNHGPETNLLNGLTFTTNWTVTDDAPYTGAKTVLVTTSWSDLSGVHTATVSFVTNDTL